MYCLLRQEASNIIPIQVFAIQSTIYVHSLSGASRSGIVKFFIYVLWLKFSNIFSVKSDTQKLKIVVLYNK